MARRFYLSPMQCRWQLDGNAGKIDLSCMPLSRFCDGWDDFSEHAKAAADLVSGGLACNLPEERCQRGESATTARFGELYDGMDMDAQTTSCYGAAWPGSFARSGRGG